MRIQKRRWGRQGRAQAQASVVVRQTPLRLRRLQQRQLQHRKLLHGLRRRDEPAPPLATRGLGLGLALAPQLVPRPEQLRLRAPQRQRRVQQ